LACGPDGVTTNSNANSARPIANSGNRPPATDRGESFVDQIARASAGLAALPAGEAILVVHSGTIRAVLAIALDLAPEQALRFVIDPLSLTRVDRLEDGWRVVAVNTS
jgi:alpha-ribazole phosphatase